MTFPLKHYLDRIGLADVPAGADGLAALQTAHMRAIPFENIDPLLGIVPELAPDALAEKLIARRRGGYCFEHNALFGRALEALGYAPRPVLARVRNASNLGGARTHHAFVVEAGEERWLADTGFGGHGALQPLRLDTHRPQPVANGTYRIRADADTGETVLDRLAGEAWIPLYGFDDLPVREIDVEAANFLCARWDGAPFSTNLMVAFHGETGRVALFNRAVTRGQPPDTAHALLTAAAELDRLLRDDCGLDLTPDRIDRIWAKIADAPTRR